MKNYKKLNMNWTKINMINFLPTNVIKNFLFMLQM